MTCPACDSILEGDPLGLFDCPQCKSRLVRTSVESEPRERARIVNPSPMKPRQLPGTISHQIDIIDGLPFYRCVKCGKRFPVSHAPNRTQSHKGRLSIVSITGQSVVDWIKRETLYSVASDGVSEISSTAIPVMVSGPVCSLCS